MNSSKILACSLLALPLLGFAPMGLCDDAADTADSRSHKDMEEMRAKMHQIHEDMQKLKANTADEMKKLRQEMQKLKDEAHEKLEKKRTDMKTKHDEHVQDKGSKAADDTPPARTPAPANTGT